jgi:hypothetical protein
MSLGAPPLRHVTDQAWWRAAAQSLGHPWRYVQWRLARTRSLQRRRDEFQQILQYLPEGGSMAEVGVWRGDTARQWHQRASRMDLIDPWRVVPGKGWWGSDVVTQRDMDWMYFGVCKHFRKEIQAGSVRVLRMTSAEALQFAEEYDLVFIDGDHTYHVVLADLRGWWPRVRPGGTLCGDDYLHGSWFGDDVIRAVNAFATEIGQVPVLIGQHWLFAKPEAE